jgi:guanylate kinase
MIYIFVGPSCSGKTSIGKDLNLETGIPELISHTTRPKRKGEVEGIHYYYVSKEEFDQIDKVEYTEYAENKYCISRKELEDKLNKNGDVFTIMDMNGVKQMKENLSDKKIKVLYFDVPKHQLMFRLIKRDGFIKGIKRMWHAIKNDEFQNKEYADYVIRNENGYYKAALESVRLLMALREASVNL